MVKSAYSLQFDQLIWRINLFRHATYLLVRHTGEDFIDEERVAIATVLSLQAEGIYGSG